MPDITAFIGGGNMASSLVGGMLRSGMAPSRIRIAEPVADRRAWLAQRFGVATAARGADVVPGADLVVLAVKPQQVRAALEGLRLDSGATLLSIAAGVRIQTLAAALGAAPHTVRSMPNTPALFGSGISGLYAPAGTPQAARARAEALLQAVGRTCWVEREQDLDAVTAVSGSGPAYVFLLAEMMEDAGVALGLPAETAALLARHTVIGAARMLEQGDQPPALLRAQVTSKGGTTEAALAQLEKAQLRAIFAQALDAAARRSRELGDQLALPED